MTDKCPGCGGLADNGYDQKAKAPYYCMTCSGECIDCCQDATKCTCPKPVAKTVTTSRKGDDAVTMPCSLCEARASLAATVQRMQHEGAVVLQAIARQLETDVFGERRTAMLDQVNTLQDDWAAGRLSANVAERSDA